MWWRSLLLLLDREYREDFVDLLYFGDDDREDDLEDDEYRFLLSLGDLDLLYLFLYFLGDTERDLEEDELERLLEDLLFKLRLVLLDLLRRCLVLDLRDFERDLEREREVFLYFE